MPNSYGPFKGPFVKRIAKNALKKCELVTSRETISQNMVYKELGKVPKHHHEMIHGSVYPHRVLCRLKPMWTVLDYNVFLYRLEAK